MTQIFNRGLLRRSLLSALGLARLPQVRRPLGLVAMLTLLAPAVALADGPTPPNAPGTTPVYSVIDRTLRSKLGHVPSPALVRGVSSAMNPIAANPGALDPSFDADGRQAIQFGGNDQGRAIAVDASGRVLVAGSTSNGNNFAVVRLLSTGALDGTFGIGGRQTIDFGGFDEAFGVAVDGGGRVLVAGYRSQAGFDFAVARLTSAGALDNTFDGDGKQTVNFGMDEVAHSIVVDGAGRVMLAGVSGFGTPGASLSFAVARLTSAGALDNTFDGDGKQTVNFGGRDEAFSMAIDASSRVLVAGVTSAGANFAMARLTSTGVLDPSFSGDGKHTVDFGGDDGARSVTLDGSGRILLAGFTSAGAAGYDFAITRLTSTGALDNTFDGDGKQTVNFGNGEAAFSIALDATGNVLVAGETNTGSTPNNFAVARLTSAGGLDSAFDGDGKQTVDFGGFDVGQAIAMDGSGNVLLAGYTNAGGAGNDFAVARLVGAPPPPPDGDSDGVSDASDNCPTIANANQLNSDGAADGGDACDADDDNDGLSDVAEATLGTNPTVSDTDGDGAGDATDVFPLDSTETADGDGDGRGDNGDNCPVTSNTDQTNTDGDAEGNDCDADDDNDGVVDDADAFPLDATESVDTDSDGIGNNADTDDDGDGVLDANDAFPFDPSESADTDSDGTGNNADADDDDDGVADAADAFPLDASEWVDTDGDGTGNNADVDDDGDGLDDAAEAATGTNPLVADTDADTIGDNTDNCPINANLDQADLDRDGLGDACDAAVHVSGAIGGMTTIITNEVTDRGTSNALASKLSGVVEKVERGQTTAAANQLDAFVNQVQAQAGKKVAQPVAVRLISAATATAQAIRTNNTQVAPDGPPQRQGTPATQAFTETAALNIAVNKAAAAVEAVPAAYALGGAYPNPFASRATVRYELPEAARVRIALYDMVGREVALVVDGEMGAGVYRAELDADGLAPGVYVMRMTTSAGQAFTQRAVIGR